MPDPYRNCEERCTHDTVKGVLTTDLLREDGPFPDVTTDRMMEAIWNAWRNRNVAPTEE